MTIKSFVRRLTTGIALAGLLLAPNTTFAKSAAKYGCKAATCNGKDPQAMGCAADAKTLTARSAYGIRVELRYSKGCKARWARTTIVGDTFNVSPFAYLGTGNITYRITNSRSVWSYM